jgi:hypothetical protein
VKNQAGNKNQEGVEDKISEISRRLGEKKDGLIQYEFANLEKENDVVPEKKRESDVNEARTTGSLYEIACTYAECSKVLARKDNVPRKTLEPACGNQKGARSRQEMTSQQCELLSCSRGKQDTVCRS